jgi:hypothetical protein
MLEFSYMLLYIANKIYICDATSENCPYGWQRHYAENDVRIIFFEQVRVAILYIERGSIAFSLTNI